MFLFLTMKRPGVNPRRTRLLLLYDINFVTTFKLYNALIQQNQHTWTYLSKPRRVPQYSYCVQYSFQSSTIFMRLRSNSWISPLWATLEEYYQWIQIFIDITLKWIRGESYETVSTYIASLPPSWWDLNSSKIVAISPVLALLEFTNTKKWWDFIH